MLSRTSAARRSPSHEAWALVVELWLRHKTHFAEVAARYGLTPTHAFLLQRLTPEQPAAAMVTLANALDCDASHVTSIVDRLERRGFVERRADEGGDRRVKMVWLTNEGLAIREALIADLLEPPDEIAKLSRREQLVLRNILRRALGYIA